MMSETNIVKKKKKPRSTIKQNGSESQKNDSITLGNSLAWLGLWNFTAWGMGSVPSQGIKISQAVQCGQKNK